MNDIPPPEAFEPQPHVPSGGDRIRRRLQVALILVLVAALIVLAAVQGSGLMSVDGDGVEPGPRLAVVDAAGALTWMDGHGGSPVSYTESGLLFQFPAWSPDGTRIAAVGTNADGGGVYVIDARAPTDTPNEPTRIYQSPDRAPFYLYWTPDGRQVSFLTTEPDGLALRVAPADGSGSAYIARSGAPMYWDFIDPDRMLVHSGSSGPDAFFGEIGLDGSPFDGTDRSAGTFRAPVVSADGRYRAYLSSANDPIGEIVRESREDAGTTRIRVFGAGALAFNPSGTELAFVAADQPTSAALPLPVGPLRILDANASEPRTLIEGNVVAFFWSPTGREIAVLQLPSADNPVTEAGLDRTVVLARATVAAPRARATVTAPRARAIAAGVGLELSVVETEAGTIRAQRSVQVSDLFVNQVLPFFDQYALSHRFWSPNGDSLILPIVGDGDLTELHVIPADGSDSSVVAIAEMGFWSP